MACKPQNTKWKYSAVAVLVFAFVLVALKSVLCSRCASCDACSMPVHETPFQMPSTPRPSTDEINKLTSALFIALAHLITLGIFYFIPASDRDIGYEFAPLLLGSAMAMYITGIFLTIMGGEFDKTLPWGACRVLSGCVVVVLWLTYRVMSRQPVITIATIGLIWRYYWVGFVVEWKFRTVFRFVEAAAWGLKSHIAERGLY
ncbi:hypothetical protein F4781DRAFT_294071 [Annulohypoxylon bovei var. microspora]|nr:hypothetical protein F4781DRAFT_294071 [Annulohypoxylon bovei var. microspora]